MPGGLRLVDHTRFARITAVREAKNDYHTLELIKFGEV